jgi:hypothetical protein
MQWSYVCQRPGGCGQAFVNAGTLGGHRRACVVVRAKSTERLRQAGTTAGARFPSNVYPARMLGGVPIGQAREEEEEDDYHHAADNNSSTPPSTPPPPAGDDVGEPANHRLLTAYTFVATTTTTTSGAAFCDDV